MAVGATGRRLPVRGQTLFVRQSSIGSPVLFLHGFMGSASDWDPMVVDMATEMRCLTIDLLGHGRSGTPPDPTRYGMIHMVEDVARVLSMLGIVRTDIVGYSMGARVALAFAIRYPQRVRRLVLESVSPGLATVAERHARIRSDEQLVALMLEKGLASFVQHWEGLQLFASQRRLSEGILERQRTIRLSQRTRGLIGSLRGLGTGRQPPLWSALPTLHVPTLLITGSEDEKFCRIAAEMAQMLPVAVWRKIDGVGHNVHLEQLRAYHALVQDFLMTPAGPQTICSSGLR